MTTRPSMFEPIKKERKVSMVGSQEGAKAHLQDTRTKYPKYPSDPHLKSVLIPGCDQQVLQNYGLVLLPIRIS